MFDCIFNVTKKKIMKKLDYLSQDYFSVTKKYVGWKTIRCGTKIENSRLTAYHFARADPRHRPQFNRL